ncbi:hypothetical protein [Clostridium tetani]|uniref:hypothetical protein n=1 Tax=Clostridium tetani TaxID=1513 RepID=UPI001146418E|nr:hypothetical protein [Clostridium tetani]
MLNTTTLSLVDLNTTLVIVQPISIGNFKLGSTFKYNSCYCSTTVKSRFLKIKNSIKPLILQHFSKTFPGDLTFEKPTQK